MPSQRHVFFSIDIDYWNCVPFSDPAAHLRKYLNRLTKLCRQQKVKLSCVMNHQQMLPKVNKSGARTLINLDTHSDFADPEVSMLDCGSWVGYVSWRKEGTFKWFHASTLEHGECSERVRGIPVFRDAPPNKNTDWMSVSHRTIKSPPSLKLISSCVEVCVCSSPAFADPLLYTEFLKWRKQFDIPYTKGIKHENYGCVRRPPYCTEYIDKKFTALISSSQNVA